MRIGQCFGLPASAQTELSRMHQHVTELHRWMHHDHMHHCLASVQVQSPESDGFAQLKCP